MDYQHLFEKYIKGNIERKELLKLLEYLESKPETELDSITKELWYSNGHKVLPDSSALLREINRKIDHDYTIGRSGSNFSFTKVAAVILFLLSTVALFFVYQSSVDKVAEKEIVQGIVKSNPSGQKSKIYLPDGSIVMLNAESTVSYPEFFADSLRRVVLEGEAFFEIKANDSMPFQVYSQGVITTALGTSFNVRAFPDEKDVTVALASGKVLVHREDLGVITEELYLEPGSAAVFDETIKRFIKQSFDYNQLLGWKDGIIYFDNASKTEVFNTLSRWYGVEILEENKTADVEWNYSSQFKNEYLENILESIGFSKDFSYQIRNKIVFIKYH